MTENQRRKFLKLVGASLGVGVLASVSCRPPEDTPKKMPGQEHRPIPPDMPKMLADATENLSLTRKIVIERLKKLAESEPPVDFDSRPSCYTMPPEREKEEIPCPECEQTMRDGEIEKLLRSYNVPLKRIQDQGLDAKLILPEHCPTCGFGLDKEILLEIKYPDHPDPVRIEPKRPSIIGVRLDYSFDLELMALFLQGKDRYWGEQEREEALKDKVEQLEKLFGVAEESD